MTAICAVNIILSDPNYIYVYNIQTVEFYRDQFNFELPSHQITVRYAKFLNTITPDIDMFATCI